MTWFSLLCSRWLEGLQHSNQNESPMLIRQPWKILQTKTSKILIYLLNSQLKQHNSQLLLCNRPDRWWWRWRFGHVHLLLLIYGYIRDRLYHFCTYQKDQTEKTQIIGAVTNLQYELTCSSSQSNIISL
jgi:hypothetical protein